MYFSGFTGALAGWENGENEEVYFLIFLPWIRATYKKEITYLNIYVYVMTES